MLELIKPYHLLDFQTLGSTNTYAREHKDDLFDRSIILARHQEQGKGRHGNRWLSCEGNLYVTIFLKAEHMTAQQAGQFSFVAALALYETISSFLPSGTKIQTKWPNDILVDDKKISGILLESEFQNGKPEYLIVGMGVNLAEKPAIDKTISFQDILGEKVQVEMFLPKLIENFEKLYTLFLKRGFQPIRQEWLSHAAFLGKEISVRLPGEEFKAIFEKINEDGALIVKTKEGKTRSISSGEVFFT